MQFPTHDNRRLVDVAGPPESELFDAVPTRIVPRSPRRLTRWALLAARVLGALAVLATGAVHLHEYEGLYGPVPTIGTLFLLNFIGATAIGLSLLAPVEQIGGRRGGALVALLAMAGIGLCATSFVLLKISQHTPLFGFMDPGYDPPGITASQWAEITAVGFLGIFLIGRSVLKTPAWRW
jgi:hypothetical protein